MEIAESGSTVSEKELDDHGLTDTIFNRLKRIEGPFTLLSSIWNVCKGWCKKKADGYDNGTP